MFLLLLLLLIHFPHGNFGGLITDSDPEYNFEGFPTLVYYHSVIPLLICNSSLAEAHLCLNKCAGDESAVLFVISLIMYYTVCVCPSTFLLGLRGVLLTVGATVSTYQSHSYSSFQQ